MRPILSDVPVWLCRWPRGRSWYIPARSSASARDLCIMAGLGCPASIAYAGFSAAPGELRRPRGRPKATVSTGTSRRVEAALAIYSILRVDWPVGSILAGFDAERRWQASDSLLRDFVANVGRAIAALAATEREVLEQVVSTQGRASWHAAQELNIRRRLRALECGTEEGRDERRTLELEAEHHANRRELFFHQARRLRKRRSYALAVGEMTSALDGELPRNEAATEKLMEVMVARGVDPEEAAGLARRYRRVVVPRM